MKKATLFLVGLVLLGCAKDKAELLSDVESQRKVAGLLAFRGYALDSTRNVTYYGKDDWKLVNYPTVYLDRIDSVKSKPMVYAVIDFYSNGDRSRRKIFYFNNTDGTMRLVSESDSYHKKISDWIEVDLKIDFNYETKEGNYRIDSLPSKKLIEKNTEILKGMFRYAKANNLDICGTSAGEIRSKGFPKGDSVINARQFRQLQAEYLRP